MTKIVGVVQTIAVPGQMLASYSNASHIPIKLVKIIQVADHNIMQFIFF